MAVWLKPRSWFRWWRDFIRSWFFTVPSSSIGPAIPSIVGAVVVLSLVGLSMVRDPAWRTDRMRGNLQTALTENDHAEVELICRRLLEDDPDDEILQFQLASVMAKEEDRAEAVARMKRLALEDRSAIAAQWLLSEEFKDFSWADAEPSERSLLGSLLAVAVEAGNANSRLAATYVDYLLAEGKLEKAQPLLDSLADQQPVRALQAAAIYRNAGDEQRAEAMAQRGIKRLEKLIAEEPEKSDFYIVQTQLLVFLERYEDTLAMLDRGMLITKENRLRQAAAETLVLWSKSEAKKEATTAHFMRRLQMLQRALKLAPQNGRVLEALVPLVLETAEEDSPNVAKLRKTLVSGVAPELSHFIRGTTAMLKGDAEEASVHLDMATKHMKDAPVVMNNLAVAVASQEDPDLDKALTLVDAALLQRPDEPYMHETRGQILLKMERYQDAIVALEKAMPASALAGPIHRGLAEAYRQIGEEEIADEHEQLAERVEQ